MTMKTTALFTAATALLLTACANLTPEERQARMKAQGEVYEADWEKDVQDPLCRQTEPSMAIKTFPNLYFPQFDASGGITNPAEIRRLRADIATKKINRFIVLSYGWMHRADEAQLEYLDNLNEYLKAESKDGNWKPTPDYLNHLAVLCVVWDSVARLDTPLRDLLPADQTVRTVMDPVNKVVTVATLWAKGAQADRIGSNGLRAVLKLAQEEAGGAANIFVVAHSFGCRIASAAVQPHMLRPSLKGVRGMLLVEPALAANGLDLPQDPDFPLVVTQSIYDHANSALFPIAGLPLNLSSNRLYSTFGKDVASEAHWENPVAAPLVDLYYSAGSVYAGPYMWPFSYLDGQLHQLKRPDRYVASTLAQLPLVQIPIEEFERAQAKKQQQKAGEPDRPVTGSIEKGKGAFDFGPLYESAARSPMHGYNSVFSSPAKIAGDVHYVKYGDRGDPWSYHGITFMDCSDILSKSGVFGADYNKNRFLHYTLGWLDPIGAHTTIMEPQIFDMIHAMIHRDPKQGNPTPHPGTSHQSLSRKDSGA